jgi:hypothetical protein
MMKTTAFFAQDKMNVAGVIDELNAHRNAHPEWHWAALVDGAFDYPEAEQTPYAAEAINCYLSDAFEGLEVAAPWLYPLPSTTEDKASLRKLLQHCNGRPMLSFVASRGPLMELKEAWAPLHWLNTTDDQRMLLRLADTRTLPELPRVLTARQWAALTAPLAQWLTIDREGHLKSCPLAPEGVFAETQIQLAQTQLDALLQAAEPDAVIDVLVDSMREALPASQKKSQLHRLVEASCALARSYQVEVFSDIVSLAVAACLTEGASNDDAKVHALLHDRRWTSGEMGNALLAEGIL